MLFENFKDTANSNIGLSHDLIMLLPVLHATFIVYHLSCLLAKK
jgi:hypothetical protein